MLPCQAIDDLLRKPNHCQLVDCVPLLQARQAHHFLALLYLSKGKLTEAATELQERFDSVEPSPRALWHVLPGASPTRKTRGGGGFFKKKISPENLQSDLHEVWDRPIRTRRRRLTAKTCMCGVLFDLCAAPEGQLSHSHRVKVMLGLATLRTPPSNGLRAPGSANRHSHSALMAPPPPSLQGTPPPWALRRGRRAV